LRYTTHIEKNSLFNTPPVFAVYITMLSTRWLLNLGGLDKMAERNRAKAGKIYAVIDELDFYQGTAAVDFRSDMNVTFRLPSEDLEKQFIAQAAEQDMKGLKGHRTVGGIRASIYNAFPPEGVDALVTFMKEFAAKNG
jgi:phosphoserine aminotransferase